MIPEYLSPLTEGILWFFGVAHTGIHLPQDHMIPNSRGVRGQCCWLFLKICTANLCVFSFYIPPPAPLLLFLLRIITCGPFGNYMSLWTLYQVYLGKKSHVTSPRLGHSNECSHSVVIKTKGTNLVRPHSHSHSHSLSLPLCLGPSTKPCIKSCGIVDEEEKEEEVVVVVGGGVSVLAYLK